jgi:hypothetical protein
MIWSLLSDHEIGLR